MSSSLQNYYITHDFLGEKKSLFLSLPSSNTLGSSNFVIIFTKHEPYLPTKIKGIICAKHCYTRIEKYLGGKRPSLSSEIPAGSL